MKKFAKLLCLALAVVMLFGLAACTGGKEPAVAAPHARRCQSD